MARKASGRKERLAELTRVVRRMGRHTVLFHQTVAARIGLSAADSRILSYLGETGPVPAGRLVELTGLTSGAITGVIDRLERGRFVRRERDPHDRRKVMVAPVADAERDRETGRLFAPLDRALSALSGRYGTAELDIIIDFVGRATDKLRDRTAALLRDEASAERR
ncbi:MAG: MarR family winged helix-turn-helix transcriptional regulator [Gemmatimonadales bacterium]